LPPNVQHLLCSTDNHQRPPADSDTISTTDLEFYVYPFADKEIVIATVPENNADPTFGFELAEDELHDRVYVKEIAAKSCASTIFNNLKASRKKLSGVFITHLNGNPVFSQADALLQLKSLQDQGVLEFSITFAPEKKLLGKELKKAMDDFHHFTPGTTKRIKSRPSSEPPDDINTVDDGSTRYHVDTTVYKTFSDEEFKGKVTGYDSASQLVSSITSSMKMKILKISIIMRFEINRSLHFTYQRDGRSLRSFLQNKPIVC
jgi:hypothetical protein